MPGTSPGMTTLLWLTAFKNERLRPPVGNRSPNTSNPYLL
jgi:hypothetical protein